MEADPAVYPPADGGQSAAAALQHGGRHYRGKSCGRNGTGSGWHLRPADDAVHRHCSGHVQRCGGSAVSVLRRRPDGRDEEDSGKLADSPVLHGVALSVVGCALQAWLLRTILGVQDYLRADAEVYFRIYALGLLAQFIYNIVSAILRSMATAGLRFISCWWPLYATFFWIFWLWHCLDGVYWVLQLQR